MTLRAILATNVCVKDIPTLEELGKAHTLAVLERVGGSITKAAQALGINRVTLHKRLKQWGVERVHVERSGEAR